MRTLVSERYAPITSSIGFLEVPLDGAARALERETQEWLGIVPGVADSVPG